MKVRVFPALLALFLLMWGCGTGGNDENETVSEEEIVTDTGVPQKETEIPGITPPEPRVFEAGGVVYAPRSTSISVEAEDIGCGVKDIETSVDGGDFRLYVSPIKFDEEGVHTIKYKARDNVGNATPIKTYSVTIDKTPPVTDYKIEPKPVNAGNDLCVPNDCRIILRTADNLSGIQRTLYSIDDSGFSEYDGFIAMPGPGAHTFVFRSQDNVGTWETEKKVVLIVDGETPISGIEPSGPLFEFEGDKWAPPTHIYYLSATDDVIGVGDIKYSIDGGKFVSYTEPIELKPGAHKINYYAVDRANNKEELKTFEVIVDSEYPVAKLNVKIE